MREVKQRITDELPRTVIRYIATTFDLEFLCADTRKFSIGKENVGRVRNAAECIDRRMFSENERVGIIAHKQQVENLMLKFPHLSIGRNRQVEEEDVALHLYLEALAQLCDRLFCQVCIYRLLKLCPQILFQ